MLLDVRLTFDIVGPDIASDIVISVMDKAGLQLFNAYIPLGQGGKADLWHIDINNNDFIRRAKAELTKYIPEKAGIQEKIWIESVEYKALSSNYFCSFGFADDTSNAEITHHTDSVLECPGCGNKHQNPRFVPAIKASKLRTKPILLSFYGPHKIFCRPEFIKCYQKVGLTGMTFIDWDEKDKKGRPLSLIYVEPHKWRDRTGVCDVCEMKTNVTSLWGLFNMKEEFRHDIQYIHTFSETTGEAKTCFILSRKAVDFFVEATDYMKVVTRTYRTCIPILPGYMEDIVWPEPKLFAHGEIPLFMLRSSWEKVGK